MAVRVATNRVVTLANRPTGFPTEADFELVEAPMPEPGPGEVLVRVLWTSVDPYQRGRMSEARSYAKPVQLGEVMTAQAVGRSWRATTRVRRGRPRRRSARAGRSTRSYEAARFARCSPRSTRRPSRSTRSARPGLRRTSGSSTWASRSPATRSSSRARRAPSARSPGRSRSSRGAGRRDRRRSRRSAPTCSSCTATTRRSTTRASRSARDLRRRVRRRRRVLRQLRRLDLGDCALAAERRRAHPDLRADLAVQRRAARADVPSRPADRVPRADGGFRHDYAPRFDEAGVRLGRWVPRGRSAGAST